MPPLERRENLGRELSEALRTRLGAGDHESVAVELADSGRPDLAAWVLEQIWDFEAASAAYLQAGRTLDALRAALEDGGPGPLRAGLEALEAAHDPGQARAAAALLTKRRRHDEAATVLGWAEAAPKEQAAAWIEAGDRLSAARALADAGQPQRALEALGTLELHQTERNSSLTAELALAARLCWDLGDAEGTARYCQEARRAGAVEGERGAALRRLLARALATLGHDLAGQLVLGEDGGSSPSELSTHGRYRVTGVIPAIYAGATYVGIDRLDLREVEIHLLLAEFSEHERPGPPVIAAIERFAKVAMAADALEHPAIRTIDRLEAREGLMVMARREGPLLRALIRPPGLAAAAGARARSLIAFLLDGLARAHAAGLTHGSLLPSQIVCDALGRPMLGPFGAHHLSGLVATRTGGLEELLALTPPEQRTGAPPTQAGDMFMLGALWGALSAGHFTPEPDELPAADRREILSWLDPDPGARPLAHEALVRVRAPVSDLSRLAQAAPLPDLLPDLDAQAPRSLVDVDPRLGRAITVIAADTWSDTTLEMLCTARNPWLQNILDRDGRSFQLAPWPEGCRSLEPGADWRTQLDPLAIDLLSPSSEPNAPGDPGLEAEPDQTLREAITSRLEGGVAIVVTPAGERMLALDRLLSS